jgi:hypothetical protein
VIFLLILAIFTRYLGKPKFYRAKARPQGESVAGRKGGKTEYSSDIGGRPLTSGDPREGEDVCTVYDDDNLSISGFSDLRSQRSGIRGGGGRQGVDLY